MEVIPLGHPNSPIIDGKNTPKAMVIPKDRFRIKAADTINQLFSEYSILFFIKHNHS